ncbi:MAG: Fic family protein, partial [Cyclobacteriaceae bacterium]|nr:Fic family protein [Cyclobacteriaceae bacterium]
CWRDDSAGPMQVVSGPMGRERVHFQAPPASKVAIQMDEYISWFNEQAQFDQIIKAAIGHLWFITIHPFEDGNGRIARVLTDMLLSQSDGLGIRFYSMSVQIRKERSEYYNILERTQKGDLDLTHWIDWFINCLSRALDSSLDILEQVLFKHRYWTKYRGVRINDRQEKLIIRLMEGFKGKLTTSKWAKIAKCSQDTALRDIQDLMNKNMMIQNIGKGKNTSYDLNKQV